MQLSEVSAENIKLEDKFLALYADKGGDDMLGQQMKETVSVSFAERRAPFM